MNETAKSSTPTPAVEGKPARVMTDTYCGLVEPENCVRLGTLADLDGYRFCEEHRHHGRFAPAVVVPPEPRAPREGDRWRPTGAARSFTIGKFDGEFWWETEHPGNGWLPSSFIDGTLAFVDHGEPPGLVPNPLCEHEGKHYTTRKDNDKPDVCRLCGMPWDPVRQSWTEAPSPAPAPEAPKVKVAPTRREVSQDGRNWCEYERLTDADPFSSYRWRREFRGNGDVTVTCPEEPRGYGMLTFAQHASEDRVARGNMNGIDVRRRMLTESAAPSPPSQPLPRESVATSWGGTWRTR